MPYNSERGSPKDFKVWTQLAKQFHRRRLKVFLPNFLFLAVAAILVGGSSDTILKGEHPKLVQIDPVVSEEKIKM